MPGEINFFKKPKRKRTSRRMRSATPKRAKQLKQYSEARKRFLLRPENLRCPVVAEIFGRAEYTSEIHHMDGREGERLLDESDWLAVSRRGHEWIHANPREAKLMGWLK